jgi:hypothetical protein
LDDADAQRTTGEAQAEEERQALMPNSFPPLPYWVWDPELRRAVLTCTPPPPVRLRDELVVVDAVIGDAVTSGREQLRGEH